MILSRYGLRGPYGPKPLAASCTRSASRIALPQSVRLVLLRGSAAPCGLAAKRALLVSRLVLLRGELPVVPPVFVVPPAAIHCFVRAEAPVPGFRRPPDLGFLSGCRHARALNLCLNPCQTGSGRVQPWPESVSSTQNQAMFPAILPVRDPAIWRASAAVWGASGSQWEAGISASSC